MLGMRRQGNLPLFFVMDSACQMSAKRQDAGAFRKRRAAVLLVIVFSIVLYFAFQPHDALRLGAFAAKAVGADATAFKMLSKIDDPDATDQLTMARLAFKLGNDQSSSQLFLTVGPDSTEDIISLGISLSRLGRWMEAVPVLEQAQKAGASGLQFLQELADSYAALGLYDKSLQTLDQLEKEGYANAALYRRGIIFREKGDFEGLVSQWTMLINNPVSGDVRSLDWEQLRIELAEVCVTRGLFQEANEILSPVGITARSEFVRGKASFGLGQSDEAVAHWKRSIELQPKALAPRIDLAKLFVGQGKAEQAKEILVEAVKENDAPTADACNLMHMIFVQQKDEAQAALWKKKRDEAEERAADLAKIIRLSTRLDTVTGKIIRAWKFASTGHQSQAMSILQPLLKEIEETKATTHGAMFVQRLAVAIREGTELPDLVELVNAESANVEDQSE